MRIRHKRGQKQQLEGHAITQDERTPALGTLRPKTPTYERQEDSGRSQDHRKRCSPLCSFEARPTETVTFQLLRTRRR